MGDPGVDKIPADLLFFDWQGDSQPDIGWRGEGQLYPPPLHLSPDETSHGLKGEVGRRHPHEVGEPRSAPPPVPTHLRLAPIGVKEAPAEMGLCRMLEDDQPISPDGEVLAT